MIAKFWASALFSYTPPGLKGQILGVKLVKIFIDTTQGLWLLDRGYGTYKTNFETNLSIKSMTSYPLTS